MLARVVVFALAWALSRLVVLVAGAFPLALTTAVDEQGTSVVAEPWLAAQIAQAQTLFAPYGVRFARHDVGPMEARFAHVETRDDRDAFASLLVPQAVNVFVVESLRDVDDPRQMRRGVHWHAPSGAHYVLIVATAPPSVLAHELGHFFGNPHSPVVDDVMSYERSGAPVFFDAAQGRRIEARARDYWLTGEILPSSAPADAKLGSSASADAKLGSSAPSDAKLGQ
jgi:hypothetical protein